MKVTHDEYELPIAVADTVKELSQLTGDAEMNIRNHVQRYRTGQQEHPFYVAIPLEDINEMDR